MPEAHSLASGMLRAGAMLFLLLPNILPAQSPQVIPDNSISVSVASEAGTPLSFSTVAIIEAGVERFSNQRGEFFLSGLTPGIYRVRVKQLGFTAKDTLVQLIAAVKNLSIQVKLTPIPFVLSKVVVTGKNGRCPQATDLSDPANGTLSTIFGEISKNADRLRLLQDRYPFTYTLAREFRNFDSYFGLRGVARDTITYQSAADWSYSPGEVVQRDSVTFSGQQVMRLPQLIDVADAAFQSSHCFYYRGTEKKEGGMHHRVDFIPLSEFDFPDVEGSVFIDTKSYVLTRALFRLTRGDRMRPPVPPIEVVTDYAEIYPNVVIFREISADQPPRNQQGSRFTGVRQRQQLVTYNFLRGKPGDSLTLVAADSVTILSASVVATFGSLTGTVKDASGNALSGASVVITVPGHNAITDKLGQFTVDGVLPGEVELTVSAQGYETIRIQVDVVASQTITLPLVLYPKAGSPSK